MSMSSKHLKVSLDEQETAIASYVLELNETLRATLGTIRLSPRVIQEYQHQVTQCLLKIDNLISYDEFEGSQTQLQELRKTRRQLARRAEGFAHYLDKLSMHYHNMMTFLQFLETVPTPVEPAVEEQHQDQDMVDQEAESEFDPPAESNVHCPDLILEKRVCRRASKRLAAKNKK